MGYKNYAGSIEFSERDGVFFGKALGVGALISYEGADLKTLEFNFHVAVDGYLDLLEEGQVSNRKVDGVERKQKAGE